MKFASFVSLCLIATFGVCWQVPVAKAIELESATSAETPVEEVKTNINKMIALIDERKILELLEKYTDIPAENREKIARDIDQDKLDELKKYLGMAAKQMPKVSDDGKTVVFENDEFPRPMKFVKSGDKWLMKDK